MQAESNLQSEATIWPTHAYRIARVGVTYRTPTAMPRSQTVHDSNNPDAVSGDASVRLFEHPDGCFIVHAETGQCHALNKFGTYIWKALRSGMPIEDVITIVTRRYGDDQRGISEDIRAFASDLKTRDLLRTPD